METQKSPLLSWPYYYQGKRNLCIDSAEELKQSLICTTLELQATRLAAQEEIRKREEQITHLQELLKQAITERDEAQESCKTLLEKLLLQQRQPPQQPPHSGSSSSIEDEPTTTTLKRVNSNNNSGKVSPSDCEETSIITSPASPSPPPPSSALPENALQLLSSNKALPEKGKLLQAVIKAGPLLQTLLLAGPLPQWRHPPPTLETFDIPPVTIPAATVNQTEVVDHQEEFYINNNSNIGGTLDSKRGLSNGVCDVSSYDANKYQRVLLR